MNKIGTLIFSQHKNELGLLANLAAAESLPLYLVGGCVRDHFLDRRSADYDFVTSTDPSHLAKKFANKINAHWFCLDQQRGYSRVVTRCAAKLQFDFAPFRGPTLEVDLSLRDFTINAMALPLTLPLGGSELIDPLNGKVDLAHQRLKMCSDSVIAADPLRIIKGLRHCAQLGLTVEAATQQQFITHATLLKQVAGERIRSELSHIFAEKNSQLALEMLFDYGVAEVLQMVAPMEVISAHYAAIKKRIDELTQQNSSNVAAQLNGFCGDSFTVESMSFFIDILDTCSVNGDGLDELICWLHFEKRTAKLLRFFLNTSAEQFVELSQLRCSDRGELLWLQHHGAPLPQSLVFIQLLGVFPVDSQRLISLQQLCHQLLNNGRIQPLLTSEYIRQSVPEGNGQQLGCYIRAIEQAEIDGKVTSVDEAQRYLHDLSKSN